MRSILLLVLPLLGALLAPAPGARAETVVLYSPQGATTPADQGFGFIVNPPFGAQTTLTGSATGSTLNTSAATGESAGFFTHNPFNGAVIHPGSRPLDRTAGFGLRFDLAVTAESHTTTNRAGFSVIAITSDARGIEIGFWTNEIWAYDDDRDGAVKLFTHAEGIAQAPAAMATVRRYDLVVLGDRYILSIDGAPALTGRLRDYRAFSGPIFPIFGELDPYEVPNLVFFGDDTSSASSQSTLGAVSINRLSPDGVRILSTNLVDDNFSMAWESLPGIRYAVTGSADLAGWLPVTTHDATDLTATITATVSNESRRFFRIDPLGIPE
jgi:hypothetical protein